MMKLPVFGTLQNGAILATRVGQRHRWVLAIFAIVYATISLEADIGHVPGDPYELVRIVLDFIGSLIIAVLTHREILVGPSPFRSLFSRPGFGRLGRYLVNSLAVGGVLVGPVLLMVIVSLAARPSFADNRFPFYLSMIALAFVSALFCARLILKLPASAVDEPLTWRQVWSLGRGNTIRLLVLTLLASALLSAVAQLMTDAIAHASPVLAHLIDGVVVVALTVLGTAWLAVSYLYLTAEDLAEPVGTGPPSERE